MVPSHFSIWGPLSLLSGPFVSVFQLSNSVSEELDLRLRILKMVLTLLFVYGDLVMLHGSNSSLKTLKSFEGRACGNDLLFCDLISWRGMWSCSHWSRGRRLFLLAFVDRLYVALWRVESSGSGACFYHVGWKRGRWFSHDGLGEVSLFPTDGAN